MLQAGFITPEQGTSREDGNTADSTSSSTEAQMNSLLSCLSVLSELAAMDSDEYQSEILKSPKASRRNPRNFPLGDSLAELERSHGLHSTPIASLTQSIHRFQSSLAILHDESDTHAAEVDSLHELIKSLQARNDKLENDVQTLTDCNKKLVMKLERKSEEKRYLASYMKNYIRKANESQDQEREFEELKVAYQLQAHENLLFQANRNRTTSADSNLSDGLDFIHLEDGSGDDFSSFSCGGSSLVTDEGVATLRLQTIRSASPRSDESHSSLDSYPPTPTAQTITLNFPRGSKVGIKILELHDDSISTPTAKKPNAELTRAMLATDADHREIPEGADNTCHFGLPFQINFFHNKAEKEGRQHRRDPSRTSVFVVSGYNDFDESLNTKPPVGSRIVAINNITVPRGCTMEQLIESLKASSMQELADDADASHYSVSFRTETLSMRQHEVLQKALKQDENEQHREEKTVDQNMKQSNENRSDMKLGKFSFGFKGRGKGNLPDDAAALNTRESPSIDILEHGTEKNSETRRQDSKTFANATSALQFWKPKNQEVESATADLHAEDPLI